MTTITHELVSTVAAYLTANKQGARLAKLEKSVAILRAAEALGHWAPYQATMSTGGFYQGLGSKLSVSPREAVQCIEYGKPYAGISPVVGARKGLVAPEVVEAWIALCNAAHTLRKQLDAARPKPVVTAIGLSPKVTKTLQECELDIDLPTIKPAEIEAFQVPVYRDGQPVLKADGTPATETAYRVKWSKGIKLGVSRFADDGCEACGKSIPSQRFVPIEASCKRLGLIGMWVGCDCAANIFGVKDKGISKGAA